MGWKGYAEHLANVVLAGPDPWARKITAHRP